MRVDRKLTCLFLLAALAFLAACPTASARYGVYSGLGPTATMIYQINNFTPYDLQMVHANASNRATPEFPLGVVGFVPKIPENGNGRAGAIQTTAAIYKSWQGDRDWLPEYEVKLPNPNPSNRLRIRFENDVTPNVTEYTRIDQLKLGLSIIKIVGNIVKGIMNPADIGNYASLVENIFNAARTDNVIRVVPGDVYAFGTTDHGHYAIIDSKDLADVRVDNGGEGNEKVVLVLQTMALRFEDSTIFSGSYYVNTKSYDYTGKTKMPNRISFNVYTMAQYQSAHAVHAALIANPQNADERKLVDFLLQGEGTEAYKAIGRMTESEGWELVLAVHSLLPDIERKNLPDARALIKLSSQQNMSGGLTGPFPQGPEGPGGLSGPAQPSMPGGDSLRTALVSRALQLLGAASADRPGVTGPDSPFQQPSRPTGLPDSPPSSF